MSGDYVDGNGEHKTKGPIVPAVDKDELAGELSEADSQNELTEQEPGQLSPEAREHIERRIGNALNGLNTAVEEFLDGAVRRAIEFERMADRIDDDLTNVVQGTSLEGDVRFVVNMLRRIAERARVEPYQPKEADATEAKRLQDAKDSIAGVSSREQITAALTRPATREELDRSWHQVYDQLDNVRAKAGYLDTTVEEDLSRTSKRIHDILNYGSGGQLGGEDQRRVDQVMMGIRDNDFPQLRGSDRRSREELMHDIGAVMSEMTAITGSISDEKFKR